MFTHISWANYIFIAALLLAAWYIIICLKFYFYDLQNILTGKIKFTFKGAHKTSPFKQHEQTTNSELPDFDDKPLLDMEENDNLFKVVDELISKLKSAISDVVTKKYNKHEFIFLLQLTLKEYPILKGSPFQDAINNLIASECEKYGFIRLSAVELMELWNEVE